MKKFWQACIMALLWSVAWAAYAQQQPATVRICDDTGCSDRPANSATFDAPVAPQPLDAKYARLAEMAQKDPRAAYDLGLRYFRGDGVPHDGHLAIKWMREAGDRGDAQAQLALGRFYLGGLEEMGADPQEAESWLLRASGQSKHPKVAAEAKKLLTQAQEARKTEADEYKWRESERKNGYRYWFGGYPYRVYWGSGVWYY